MDIESRSQYESWAHPVREDRVDFTSETNGAFNVSCGNIISHSPVLSTRAEIRFWETPPNAANADLDGFGVPSVSHMLQYTCVRAVAHSLQRGTTGTCSR